MARIGLDEFHIAKADGDDAPTIPEDFRHRLRAACKGAIIVAGNTHETRAQAMIASGLGDLVAFGRPFIANPDLACRFREGIALAAFDGATSFGGTRAGYADYPAAP